MPCLYLKILPHRRSEFFHAHTAQCLDSKSSVGTSVTRTPLGGHLSSPSAASMPIKSLTSSPPFAESSLKDIPASTTPPDARSLSSPHSFHWPVSGDFSRMVPFDSFPQTLTVILCGFG